jgi:glycosyltransferase involved in cell wall biosynthesis
MKRMKLAVIFDQQIRAGGGYQQALNAALLTKQLPNDLVDVVFYTTVKTNVDILREHEIRADFVKISLIQKIHDRIRSRIIHQSTLTFIKRLVPNTVFEGVLLKDKIDLVYFLSPSHLALSLENLNYMMTVWDLCHRDYPEFPEVRRDRQFESREFNYKLILPPATAILVDSELCKKNLSRRYSVDEDRIHVLPFQAAVATRQSNRSPLIDIRAQYKLKYPYIFYPAQFWAHKNHVYILDGLKNLETQHGMKIGAVFSGGDFGNLSYVKNYANLLDLEDRICFAGFVDNDLVPHIYQQSVALVMPTYFGPTNLPPLEAFELGVPVLYSDKDGLRDQVGDAALLMDLNDPMSMANHLNELLLKPCVRDRLIQAGKNRAKYFDAIDRVGIVKAVIENFRSRRLCWE